MRGGANLWWNGLEALCANAAMARTALRCIRRVGYYSALFRAMRLPSPPALSRVRERGDEVPAPPLHVDGGGTRLVGLGVRVAAGTLLLFV